MRRREFITLLGGAATWPFPARAQHNAPLIGFLSSRSPEDSKPHLAGFLRGLAAFGYVDGKTATIEYRWAMGRYDQLPTLASELIGLHPTIIAAPGGMPSARAAKLATNTIPIFFVTSDSVQEGLVASLSQPGGNITGVDIMSGELTGKRLELLARLVASGRSIAFLTNPTGQQSSSRAKDFEEAARSLSRTSIVADASTDAGLDDIFSSLAKKKVGGVVVENDPFFDSRREHLIRLTAQRAIAAIYHIPEFPKAGGLMSYGANLVDSYYQMGIQAGRFLKGVNFADLPVIRPTKFELTLNLTTAKALGLDIPPGLLAIADEVIE
ncbi:MAG TPA: ABC transporter substrate-binding protein [Pseudolabrys sp.]|nr:ABC transporter substrate-binding protein [Pseudolabrys sp.]